MTDLHTHILPGMDDGPEALSDAAELLRMESLHGVERVALTSHYHMEQETAAHFLERRETAFQALQARCPEGITLKRGCEAFFTPALLEAQLEPLCLEGTKVLLLELPVLQKPAFLKEVLLRIREQGITPLIAHVERYRYVDRDPRLLAEWIRWGALIQVNAGSVIRGGLARSLIRWGLCHVIASDTHSLCHRPPNLQEAMEAVSGAVGREKALELEQNAAVLFSGGQLPPGKIHVPRKLLGRWI